MHLWLNFFTSLILENLDEEVIIKIASYFGLDFLLFWNPFLIAPRGAQSSLADRLQAISRRYLLPVAITLACADFAMRVVLISTSMSDPDGVSYLDFSHSLEVIGRLHELTSPTYIFKLTLLLTLATKSEKILLGFQGQIFLKLLCLFFFNSDQSSDSRLFEKCH